MQTNESRRCAESHRFVEITKTRCFHQGIRQSPHEAMFGCKAKVGLSTSNLPREVIDNAASKEDLINVQQEMEDSINAGTASRYGEAAVLGEEPSESSGLLPYY